MPEKRRGGPSERAYAKLTRYERQTIEGGVLDRERNCREIAAELGGAADRRQRGRAAPVRHGAESTGRGVRAVGPLRGVRAPAVLAEVLQRVPRGQDTLLHDEDESALRRPHGAARRGREAPREQARHRRDGADSRHLARRDPGVPAPGPVARADSGHAAGPQPLGEHRLLAGRRWVRRDDQHRALAQGRVQAEVAQGAHGRGLRFDRLTRGDSARDVARELRAARQARPENALGDAPGRLRQRRPCAAGRLRRGDAGALRARLDAGLRGEGTRGGAVVHGPRTHRDASTRILHLRERGRDAPSEASRPSR